MQDFVESLGVAFAAHRLRRLVDTFIEGTGAWLPGEGVTVPAKANSMLTLLGDRPLPVTRIAERLRLTHPFIVQLADRLETDGLVETRADPADRRRRIVALTRAGKEQRRRLIVATGKIASAYRDLGRDAGVDLLAVISAIEAALAKQSFSERLAAAAPVKESEDVA